MKIVCIVCCKDLSTTKYVCTDHPKQGVLIAPFSQKCQPELLKELKGGACRGFVLLWIRHMKLLKDQAVMGSIKALSSFNFSDLRNSEEVLLKDEGEIRMIMKTQTELLQGISYRWSGMDDKPFSDVKGEYASFAKDNQRQAIEARHKLAQQWANNNDLYCIETRCTFGSTKAMVARTIELGKQYGGVLGYLGIQGKGGHALGFGFQQSKGNDFDVMFFDPNSGEYLFRSPESFATPDPSAAWLNRYLNQHYAHLLDLIYVHFFL